MKEESVNYSDYAAYLTQYLGRAPDAAELETFENNQSLMKISRRMPGNDAYQITFVNDTAVQLLDEGILLGSALQLHSQEGNYRFYSVLFKELGSEEEHSLMLAASIESVMVNGRSTDLVHEVRLITIEELVMLYSPVMYDLS